VDSPTYKRLSASLAVAFLGMLFFGLTPSTAGEVTSNNLKQWLILFVHLLPSFNFLKIYGFNELGNLPSGVIASVTNLIKVNKISSAVYAALSAVLMIFVLYFLRNPAPVIEKAFSVTADATLTRLGRSVGFLLFLLSVSCFSLKDGADRGRLAYSTFKTLNIASCLASLASIRTVLSLNKLAADAAAAAAESGKKAAAKGVTQVQLNQSATTSVILVLGILAAISGFHALTAKKE